MKIKCIWEYSNYITEGRIYTVIREKEDIYLITDDNGNSNWFSKNKFEILEEEIKFKDIETSPIEGIEINYNREKTFLDEIIGDEDVDIMYIDTDTKLKTSEIPQLIEWLQKVSTYIEQNKVIPKEMTIEEIEKELGHRIRIVGDEK